DRRALPKPEDLLREGNYEAPADDLERGLAGLWQQILGRKQISRHDSFFALGGSSLKTIQLIARIYKTHEVQLTIGEIFSHPELSAQAILIRESKKSRYVPIRQAPAQEWYDLSPSQRRSWLQEQLNTDDALPLNGMELFRLEGVLDRTSLEQAFSTLVD